MAINQTPRTFLIIFHYECVSPSCVKRHIDNTLPIAHFKMGVTFVYLVILSVIIIFHSIHN